MDNIKNISSLIIGVGGNINTSNGLHPIEVGKIAIEEMKNFSIKAYKRSSWYISEPIPKSDQPDFYNCVVIANTYLNEFEVLENLQLIETTLGRKRVNVNGPRSIDLDIISFGNKISKIHRLILPHPRAHLRRFVMEPIAEINPLWLHPVLKINARQILNNLKRQKIKVYKEFKILD